MGVQGLVYTLQDSLLDGIFPDTRLERKSVKICLVFEISVQSFSVCNYKMTMWDIPKKSEIPKLLLECIAEAFGTFIIVFFGCGSALSPATSNTQWPDVVQISLAFGLAVFVGAQITGPISGGYMNPAVTFAGFIVGRLSLIRSILFVIFQIIGGIAGAGILTLLTPHEIVEARSLGMNSLANFKYDVEY